MKGAGASHLFGWVRRIAGSVTGRQAAGVDLEPLRRNGNGRATVPGAVESRESARSRDERASAQAGAEIMRAVKGTGTKTRRHENAKPMGTSRDRRTSWVRVFAVSCLVAACAVGVA